jgi:membrane-associated HD superfamily phosphohydrolase
VELALPLTLVLTFLSPFISAYIQNVNWSPKTKTLLAMALSLLIAVLYLIMTGGIGDWSQIGLVIPAVFGVQQAIFQFFLRNIATKFEAITQFGSLVITPGTETGTVDITSDATIKETGDNISVDTPVQIVTPPAEITTETPAKG